MPNGTQNSKVEVQLWISTSAQTNDEYGNLFYLLFVLSHITTVILGFLFYFTVYLLKHKLYLHLGISLYFLV